MRRNVDKLIKKRINPSPLSEETNPNLVNLKNELQKIEIKPAKPKPKYLNFNIK